MDGPHDLGGKDGFGPIDVDSPPFAAAWEARQWALSKNVPLPGGTIDWWRHGIENMDPATYLSLPYFEKWCLNEMAHRIDQGMFSMAEVLGERTGPKSPAPAALDQAGVLAQLKSNNTDFRSEPRAQPIFKIGDTVRTQKTPISGHTRLPAYARGHEGRITHHHGGHLFADEGAKGNHVAAHLYTVEFKAQTLWGTTTNDVVCLDLWEPYLETV